jgi:hypothetical protein
MAIFASKMKLSKQKTREFHGEKLALTNFKKELFQTQTEIKHSFGKVFSTDAQCVY